MIRSVVALGVLLAVSPLLAANLPPGFAESIYAEIAAPENFSQMAFTPSGELFIADKFGNVPGVVYPARFRIYAAATARPAEGDGRFPADPYFEWIGSTNNTSYTYQAPAEHAVYLVVAIGTDRLRGPLGHYDQ